MGSFFNLVQNENMKIYRRIRTWIMAAIILVVPILIGVVTYFNTKPQGMPGAWNMFSNISSLYMLVTIFSVIIFSDIVASEFTWGTIKLLLIRPWTRSKILLSKLLAGLIFTLFLTILFVAANFAISFFMFPNKPSLDNALPGSYTPAAYYMENLLYRYVDLLVISLFAFMISTLFRTSGIAIGVGIFLQFASNIFQVIFNPEKFAWAKYLLFNNMDLSVYMLGGGKDGMTFGFSVAVLVVYAAVFLVISWLVFARRDVSA